MKRQGPKLLKAYDKIIQYLQTRGFHPRVHWLENQASNAMKTYDKTNNIEYQLVPPLMHRRNAAERVIRTWEKSLYCWPMQHGLTLSHEPVVSIITTGHHYLELATILPPTSPTVRIHSARRGV